MKSGLLGAADPGEAGGRGGALPVRWGIGKSGGGADALRRLMERARFP